MGLTHDELRDVLARAEEIQSASRQGEEMSVELEAVIAAAEEVGLARPAVERAIRERLNLPAALPAVGLSRRGPSPVPSRQRAFRLPRPASALHG